MDAIKEIYGVDIKENFINRIDGSLLAILLKDRSSGKNIIWATDAYSSHGVGFGSQDQITPALITGKRGCTIKPRTEKSKREQQDRIKNKAEVFTPSWVCNKQNNLVDNAWFGRENVFNTETEKGWVALPDKITFPDGKTWQDYVKSNRLEITCGEAPYLTSRYDAVTGEYIDLKNRIGLLDRKLRVVSENVDSEPDWYNWALTAFKSIYGFDWQGDNVLLARENLLFAFVDAYVDKFGVPPINDYLKEVATVLSWNIWQMDGLKFVIPNSCKPMPQLQMSIFDDEKQEECEGCKTGNNSKHTGIYSIIKDWQTNKDIKFYKLLGGKKMKFDFIIGNPPFNEDTQGTSDKPVYNYFMEETYRLSDRVILITPARFLFNAGKTPKAWNEKMLADPYIKVEFYEQDSSKVFMNTDIKGGVAITYRDSTKECGAIYTFSTFPELNAILKRVVNRQDFVPIDRIIYGQNKFALDKLYEEHSHYKQIIGSDGRERRLTSPIFSQLDIFTDTPQADSVKILGLINNNRVYKYVARKYLDAHENLDKYKVVLPKSNGSGAIGEVLSTPLIGLPLIGLPLIGHTQSFISIGAFDTENEAKACLKYVKTRFARTMLGILKITQDNPPEKWKYVPLQDFTSNSDIDWTQSVAEIDVQLYKKYGLDEKEISFIESHVKEMN